MASEGFHLETSDAAAYLDRVLSDVERARIEAHLAECRDCRREIVDVSRLRHAGSSRRAWLTLIPAAAAAVLAIVLLRPREAAGPTLREGGGGGGGGSVTVVAPAESVGVATSPQFIWRSVGTDASYRFTLSDARGDLLWSAAVTDTTVQLPSSVSLRPGRLYFWYVDALLPDGQSVTSGLRRLSRR